MAKQAPEKQRPSFRITCRELVVRPEDKKEVPAIRDIIREAFDPMPYSTGQEWKLVENIRQSPGYLPSLALVALCDGTLVGHSMISLIEIEDKKKTHNALVLGPVSVLPDYQRRGIGQEMIRIGIAAAKRTPLPVLVVVGDPAYYSRFGFVPAVPQKLHMPFGVEAEDCLQVLERKKGGLKVSQGTIKVPPSFFDEKGDLL